MRTFKNPGLEPCDVRDIATMEKCLRNAVLDLGPVSVLVNNVGNDERHGADEISGEYWDDRIAVNLRQQFFAAREVAREIDLIANKRVSRRGVFPFRFRGSCRLEPGLDGEVTPEIVQSAGGFDEGVLKARLEVAINVTDATEDLDSSATVLDAHP